MKNTIIVYKSTYGFTTDYAKWIADELNCQIVELTNLETTQLEKYDIVIYLAGIYASKLNGLDEMMKKYNQLTSKSLVIGMVGITDVNDDEKIKSFLTTNKLLTSEKIKVFYLHGGLNYQKLKFIHKTIINLVITATKKKPNLTVLEKELVNVKNKSVNYTNKNAIKPILDYINNIK